MDLKKEIKLSDLFRRNGKDSSENGQAADEAAEPKRRLFSRAPKAPKEPKAPKAPRAPKGKSALDADARTAPPVPQIPLMRAFNLLPREARRETATRRPGLAQVAVALVAIVALAALGAMFLMTDASLQDKRGERDALQQQLRALQAQVDESERGGQQPELASEQAARTTALAKALRARVAWDRLLRELALVLPGDVYVQTLTANAPAPLVAVTAQTNTSGAPVHFALTGSTDKQADVALTLSRLSIIPELTNVRLVSAQRPAVGEAIVFTINATVRHEGVTS
jgi:Tfp pilus assembly protein PilN